MNAEAEVLFFGNLTEVTGESSIRLWDVEDTDSVEQIVLNRYPELRKQMYLIALDRQLIHTNRLLKNNHTIAFMPPFSGG
ncbi:molybdopterin synthase subunit MoaD [Arachidicoccus rhizosphaerae]|jgi:molybdopterin synthase sulfur carrier subunit|uniref:Molybdopterin synthase subunit MoaD n=1 Tax=Arachidicoccus rhizosphaerae TaxID=551991 RepID=A0A1H3WCY1_9BACT|nr:MoaD/ThiS family protein [Arachidicoccus rhizosphaerae]SDZ84118.1 molybdopterin synthase subunit MoaD [Arachidicoccus rhizosphaerae]